MINKLMKSLIDQETVPVLLCDTECNVLYANPAAVKEYRRDLTGRNVKDCHNENSNAKIQKIIDWFAESEDNNVYFLYHNPKSNQDVFMIALRDEDTKLIGFYEKHAERTLHTGERPKLY